MTHWNHRVFSSKYGKEKEFTELSIREVFYNDDGTIFNYSGPVAIEGETIDELKQTLEWCLESLKNPILEEEKVVVTDTDDLTEEEEKELLEFDNLEDLFDAINKGDEENE